MPGRLIATMIGLGILSFIAFLTIRHSQSGSDPQANSERLSETVVPNTPSTIQTTPLQSEAFNRTASAIEPRPEIKLLLTAKPGHVSKREATELMNKLKADAVNVQPELEALSRSTNLNERLLGLYALLQIHGPSEAILASASADASPSIHSETAAWLYANGKFNEWNAFLQENSSTMNAGKLEAAFSLLDSKPVRLELPAALALLNLGRGLPDYIAEIFRRNAEAVALAQQQIADESISSIRKENLLSLLHEANPQNYATILQDIIQASEVDSPLRWKALWNYSQTASGSRPAAFLSQWVDSHPDDRLHDRLQMALTEISSRNSANEPIANLEQQLRANAASSSSTDDSYSSFRRYVEQSIRTGHTAARDVLEFGKSEYGRRELSDHSFRQTLANIDYLMWRDYASR
jgi:hypothetical protein